MNPNTTMNSAATARCYRALPTGEGHYEKHVWVPHLVVRRCDEDGRILKRLRRSKKEKLRARALGLPDMKWLQAA